MVDALSGLAIVTRLGPENVGNERLGIAVVEWKPGGLDVDHDAVAGEEDMICVGKREAIKERLVGGNGLGRLKTLAVAAAETLRRNQPLIAAPGWLSCPLVRIDGVPIEHPVRVR